MNYYFDIDYIIRSLPLLASGAVLTIEVSVVTIVLSSLFALPLVLVRISKNNVLSTTMYYYIQVMRNTPTLIKIYLAYFGLPSLGVMLDPVAAGVIALVIDHIAYVVEIYRAGVASIGKGQIDAAKSIGFRTWQINFHVLMPQAFVRSLPALGNQFVIAIKDTSLLVTISVMELTMVGNRMAEQTGNSYEVFLITAFIYLIIITSMSLLLQLVEKKKRFTF